MMPERPLRLARHLVTRARHRAALLRASADRGDVVGWVIVLPVALAMFLTAVQAVMWYQARNMCQAAAQAGAQAAATYQAPAGTGTQTAVTYLHTVAGSSVSDGTASETATATTITVTCTARPFTLAPIPGLTSATQSATTSRELFTTPGPS